jgi:hypothetical protein
MNIYSVVEFIEDHSLEAVPTNWIKKDICAWPITKNFSTIRKLIERKCVPNKIEFIYFKAKVLKTTGKQIFEMYHIFKYIVLNLIRGFMFFI